MVIMDPAAMAVATIVSLGPDSVVAAVPVAAVHRGPVPTEARS